MANQLIFIGLDVDDNAFHGHCTSEDGHFEIAFSCKPSLAALERKLVQLDQKGFTVKICYEATYLGFSLQRELALKGYHCDIIAPSLIPKSPGDQIKTDRLDCQKLSQYYKAGILTVIHVPDEQEEIIRDLLRSRKFVVAQMKANKLYITSLCRRLGLDYKGSTGKKKAEYWTEIHIKWLKDRLTESENSTLKFNINMLLLQLEQFQSNIQSYTDEIERIASSEKYKTEVQALSCYRGLDTITAMTLVSELGDIRRFDHPKRLASYAGMDLKEYSSGGKDHRFSITKLGNRHIRTAVIESSQFAWQPVRLSARLRKRRQNVDPSYAAIADRCMSRLHAKATRLIYKGKARNKVKVACARELLCFVWETLTEVKKTQAA
ncbi:MAG: IS110 family transposase [Bdellovibrionia bacterium]